MNFAEQAIIAIGSNLHNPQEQVKKAFDALAHLPDSRLDNCSSLYCSSPQGPQDQDDYINAACLLSTNLSPPDLLRELQAIEHRFGRIKTRHWGERIIDLDIAFYGQQAVAMEEPDLHIPHREALKRDFVFIPVLEIVPMWQLPNGKKLADCCDMTSIHVLTKLAN